MKKIVALVLIFPLIFCSCDTTDYSDIESKAIVSAIGIDNKEDKILLTMEIVKTDGAKEKGVEATVIETEGQNLYECLSGISSKISKTLFYSHCAVIAFGENLNPKVINNMLDFCFLDNEFTLLLKIVSTNNANQLLKATPKNQPIVGYEIMSILSSREKNLSIGYKNSYINISRNKNEPPFLYALPFIKLEQQKSFSLKGVKFYENNLETVYFDEFDGTVYEILSNNFSSGQVVVKDEGSVILSSVLKSKTKLNCSFKNNKLKINVIVNQNLDAHQTANLNVKSYKNAIYNSSIKILRESFNKNIDLLGVLEHLKKFDNNIYKKIRKNFKSHYKNSVISFAVNIKEG